MRLIKLFIWFVLLVSMAFFLQQNHDLNPNDLRIWLYYGKEVNLKLTVIISITVLIGFIFGLLISAIQIISHKTEIISLKSSKRKLQVELDTLRNQSIMDDIEIKDSSENIKL